MLLKFDQEGPDPFSPGKISKFQYPKCDFLRSKPRIYFKILPWTTKISTLPTNCPNTSAGIARNLPFFSAPHAPYAHAFVTNATCKYPLILIRYNKHEQDNKILCDIATSRSSCWKQARLTMEQSEFVNLIFLFGVNVLFFLSGTCLNSLVILSFWGSSQLRRKLCYFMIMVLSCCDLLAVLTNHIMLALIATFWMTGNLDSMISLYNYTTTSNMFLAFSLLALLVLSFDRYLAVSYPFFHRTSVTRGRL